MRTAHCRKTEGERHAQVHVPESRMPRHADQGDEPHDRQAHRDRPLGFDPQDIYEDGDGEDRAAAAEQAKRDADEESEKGREKGHICLYSSIGTCLAQVRRGS